MSTQTKVFAAIGMLSAVPVVVIVAGLAFNYLDQLEMSTGQLLGGLALLSIFGNLAAFVSMIVDCIRQPAEA
jgi:hypothetical protein